MHGTLPGLPGGGVDMGALVANATGGFEAQGSIAQRLLSSGFKVNSLRTLATLRKDEWIALDAALLAVARQRLTVTSDIIGAGLSYPLNNALGHTRLEWETVGDMGPAEINMSGLTEAENDRLNFELVGMPIPIISKDFHINIRALMASRNGGTPLDTTQVALAGRLVAEKIEDLVVNGGFTAGSLGTIYGITNHPNRNTASVTASWVSTTGANIIADAIEMLGVAHADRMYGPYALYMPAQAWVNCSNDFKAESDKTILERLQSIPGFNSIKPSDNLSNSNVTLIQMTSDVIDIVNGIQPTVIQWETKGGMQFNFKVLAIMAPRVKADQVGRSGIVHYS